MDPFRSGPCIASGRPRDGATAPLGIFVGTSVPVVDLLRNISGLLLAIIVICVLLVDTWRKHPITGQMAAFGLSAIVALTLCLPYALPYLATRPAVGQRSMDEVRRYSAQPSSYLAASSSNRLYGAITERFGASEKRLFPALWRPCSPSSAWSAALGRPHLPGRLAAAFDSRSVATVSSIHCSMITAPVFRRSAPPLGLACSCLLSAPSSPPSDMRRLRNGCPGEWRPLSRRSSGSSWQPSTGLRPSRWRRFTTGLRPCTRGSRCSLAGSLPNSPCRAPTGCRQTMRNTRTCRRSTGGSW